jgi:hypothetical protein
MMASKSEIAELINGWAFYRDQERWDELLHVFHEGGNPVAQRVRRPLRALRQRIQKDRADPVGRASLPHAVFKDLEGYPAELRFLASSLGKAGVALSKAAVLDKSPEMEALYASGNAWLGVKTEASAKS